ncbi:hypothetical protein R3Q08_07440 [Rhodococcus erythropolis]|jgi:hypothetical protein|uniref:hypothetical protein n=1 Tax=Rhodococcus TaxID=1827 RepID=UPI0002F82A5D|nr:MULTISPECIES: hypothetical protein [Rhodococcus]EQM31812.1 hypothetical protein N601_20165 [Rhodococcus erythropolis DN1]MDV6208064.1 hypothetical protein [Rhodococcus erythropolis]OFE06756.1 hypothetical protein A5N83_20745 [Rhodococcus sp. 1139]RAL33781.1 hypothetical protein CVN56_12470 [Rhodococcus sp. AQ5-07]
MGLFYMFVGALAGGRRRKRRAHPKSIKTRMNRRRAEQRYIENAVRRKELDAQAARIYRARRSPPPAQSAQQQAAGTYRDPRDFWTG